MEAIRFLFSLNNNVFRLVSMQYIDDMIVPVMPPSEWRLEILDKNSKVLFGNYVCGPRRNKEVFSSILSCTHCETPELFSGIVQVNENKYKFVLYHNENVIQAGYV